jgi:hypothetical protein
MAKMMRTRRERGERVERVQHRGRADPLDGGLRVGRVTTAGGGPPRGGHSLEMALAWTIPWGIVSVAFPPTRPELRFSVGFSFGALCMWVVSAGRLRVIGFICFCCAAVLLHFVLGPRFIG